MKVDDTLTNWKFHKYHRYCLPNSNMQWRITKIQSLPNSLYLMNAAQCHTRFGLQPLATKCTHFFKRTIWMCTYILHYGCICQTNNMLNIIQFNAHPIIWIFFFFQKEFQKNTESSAHIDIVWVSIWSIHLMFKYKVPEQACKYLD